MRELAQVGAVEQDRADLRVVVAQQQVDQRALARAPDAPVSATQAPAGMSALAPASTGSPPPACANTTAVQPQLAPQR